MITKEIDKAEALNLIYKYHYSKVMPKLTKKYLGFFEEDKLIGTVTLGWGTQPLATINKIFPSEELTTKDYFEIGKMCVVPEYNNNKNTVSRIISILIKYLKNNYKDLKFLYTLADGIVGKVGYAYQASNFKYIGSFWTDVYLDSTGEKIHPRTSKELCKENAIFLSKEKVFWLTEEFCVSKGIKRIKGKMFRYVYPLNKEGAKIYNSHYNYLPNPKQKDLQWKELNKGKYIILGTMPNFKLDILNHNKKNFDYNNKVCFEKLF